MRAGVPALVLALVTLAGASAPTAQCDRPPALSAAQLGKLLAYARSPMGAPAIFYAPLPYAFGWRADPDANAPIREVATDDYVQSFALSTGDAGAYLITARRPGGIWYFATGPDLCLRRVLWRRASEPPRPLDVAAPDVRAEYRRALRAWATDLDHSAPPP